MDQLSVAYALTGPDGTRAVFGNSDTARADPDWLAFIDPEQGLAGLAAAEHRGVLEPKVEEDGAVAGNGYAGARPVVLNLWMPPWLTVQNSKPLEQKLKRAARGRRGDCELRWTPTHLGLELRLLLRRNGQPTFTGRRPRKAQIPMVSSDHLILSSAEAQQIIVPDVGAGIVGYTSPYTSPYDTEVAAAGQGSVVNQGDEETTPRFRVDGPITNPEILHNGTGKRIKLLYTLAGGEWLDIDPRRRTVLLGGTASRHGAVVFPTTKWFKLLPGSNDIRLLAAAYSAGAQLTVYWRHAFE